MTAPRTPPHGAPLARQDIVDGLKELLAELHQAGHGARMQIIGGAAIALTIDASRRATRDVDGPFAPVGAVREAAARVAARRGWPEDWVNDQAAQFLPSGMGRPAEWATLYQEDGITVQAATGETLLAMKLHAAQRRHLREADDLAALLSATGTRTLDAAEDLYGQFYPGDEFTPRLATLLEHVLARLPEPPAPPSVDLR